MAAAPSVEDLMGHLAAGCWPLVMPPGPSKSSSAIWKSILSLVFLKFELTTLQRCDVESLVDYSIVAVQSDELFVRTISRSIAYWVVICDVEIRLINSLDRYTSRLGWLSSR